MFFKKQIKTVTTFRQAHNDLISAISGNSPKEVLKVIDNCDEVKKLVNTPYPHVGKPLDIAAHRGFGDIVEILLYAGAKISKLQYTILKKNCGFPGSTSLSHKADLIIRRNFFPQTVRNR